MSKQQRLIVLDPGHFHASLLQKENYPELDRTVAVYAPPGPELQDYLKRVSAFPHWEIEQHISNRSLQAMLEREKSGVVVLSGRNRGKIEKIIASLNNGLHALADKPWIISSAEISRLQEALDLAASRNLAAYDIMTERFEITSQVQRKLVNTPAVFGTLIKGDKATPAVRARSVHHIMKVVAGVPLQRPTWFFDVADYGEGLADVGAHPVDLIQWIALPEGRIDLQKDVVMISGRHEALRITPEQFRLVTKTSRDEAFDYFCNNYVEYTLRGSYVSLDVLWAWEAKSGGDIYEASFRGTRATVEVRQGEAERFQSEVYVAPAADVDAESVFSAVRAAGFSFEAGAKEARINIPAKLRVSHEDHFGQVASQFFKYMLDPASLPGWERDYMLAKYYVTTRGVEMSRGK